MLDCDNKRSLTLVSTAAKERQAFLDLLYAQILIMSSFNYEEILIGNVCDSWDYSIGLITR